MNLKDKSSTALKIINNQLQIVQESSNFLGKEDQFKQLSQYLNDLADNDFNKLLAILYRIDVSEIKVREALANNNAQQSAGEILAKLLIEREIQKIEWRSQYSSKK